MRDYYYASARLPAIARAGPLSRGTPAASPASRRLGASHRWAAITDEGSVLCLQNVGPEVVASVPSSPLLSRLDSDRIRAQAAQLRLGCRGFSLASAEAKPSHAAGLRKEIDLASES